MNTAATIDTAFFVTWLAASVRLGGPVLLAALGETYCERAGVLNIGLEGCVLFGALGSYLVAVTGAGPGAAFVAGGMSGMLVGLPLVFLYVTAQASQVVVGIVFNILAGGVASYGYELAIGERASPTIAMFGAVHIPLLSSLPVVGPILFRQPLPLYLTLLLVIVAEVVLMRTRFGLAMRAVGENPRAAHAAGLNVARLRAIGVLLSASAGGFAGSYLITAEIGLFRDTIVNGQGFIALAIVMFGRWNPIKAMFAALVFGGANALQLSLQLFNTGIPAQLLLALPYALTIIAVSGVIGKSIQPAALTIPYRKD
jgi:general nucleoside transport system permease protein